MKKTLPLRLWCLALILGACVWMANGGAHAQKTGDTRTLVVMGSAAAQGGTATALRDAAIANGLLNAVAMAVAELLSPEVFAENFKKLNEQLLNRPEAYVQDFRVLSESAASRQHRVVVQATVAVKQIADYLAGAGLARGKAAAASKPVALAVEGSGNLGNFVKFRKGLGEISGVEGIQVKDMLPNETTLLVAYRGTPQELAEALKQLAFDAVAVNVASVGDEALRVAIVPK